MKALTNKLNEIDEKKLYVIHPMYDAPEKKMDVENIGKIKMTKTVKYSLMALRCYLIIMLGLAVYRTLVMAGLFVR